MSFIGPQEVEQALKVLPTLSEGYIAKLACVMESLHLLCLHCAGEAGVKNWSRADSYALIARCHRAVEILNDEEMRATLLSFAKAVMDCEQELALEDALADGAEPIAKA